MIPKGKSAGHVALPHSLLHKIKSSFSSQHLHRVSTGPYKHSVGSCKQRDVCQKPAAVGRLASSCQLLQEAAIRRMRASWSHDGVPDPPRGVCGRGGGGSSCGAACGPKVGQAAVSTAPGGRPAASQGALPPLRRLPGRLYSAPHPRDAGSSSMSRLAFPILPWMTL